MVEDQDELISQFRSELLTRSARDMCRRFLTFGSCAKLADNAYHALKSNIAEKFEIHPNEILVVGSTKLGFSIVPDKRYRAFGDYSDIDVAIISPRLFDRVWQEIFVYLESRFAWGDRHRFQDYFIRGWIRPDKLPPGDSFAFTQGWFDFFRQCSNSREYGDIKISGGLYRDWVFLEKYQERCIIACRESDEVGP